MTRVVIVGASAAGLAAAETLRRDGFDGRIHLIGDEPHAPYDRPPLSKQLLDGSWTAERCALRTEADLVALEAEFALGRRAVAADADERTITLDDEELVRFDGLVIATGVTPIRSADPGVLAIRTLDDARRLNRRLVPGARVVILGAGFLGTELAAAAVHCGCRVTLLDRNASLLAKLGAAVSEHLTRLHLSAGVEVRSGCAAAVIDAHGATLADGTRIEADVVVQCIGSVPATAWLTGSGVPIADGVLCDETCAAAPGIVAAGDVARWLNPAYGRSMRVEQRANATQQGAHAARTLLAQLQGDHGTPYACVPYAWSNQFGTRIQIHGAVEGSDEAAVVAGSPATDSFVVAHRAHGRLVGIVGVNASPRDLRTWQQSVMASTCASAAVA